MKSASEFSTKAALSGPRRRLVEMMTRLDFGRIEQLRCRNGEPAYSPPPRILRSVKLGSAARPRPEADQTDFRLKAEVVQLFEQLAQLGDGTVELLEVSSGLPTRIVIAQPV